MPTVFGHVSVPLALGLGLGKRNIPRPLMAAGVVLAVMPDLDVLAFKFGIPYSSPFGHRGFSHSLVFAALMALVLTSLLRSARQRSRLSSAFLFISGASHGLLDCLTDGGLGIALLWPFSEERFFAPVRAIKVSPLGVSRLFSDRGIAVLQSELVWLWLPAMVLAAMLCVMRKRRLAGFR